MKRWLWFTLATALPILCLLCVAFATDPNPPQKTPELVNVGKRLYEQNCTACHGPKGEGKGPAAAALVPHPVDFAQPLRDWPNTKGSPEKIFEIVSKGIPNSAMVGWSQLPEKDRWGLVYFVMEFVTHKK
jgi:high-affinity iron transporter